MRNPAFKAIEPNYRKRVLEITLQEGRKLARYDLPFAAFTTTRVSAKNRFVSIEPAARTIAPTWPLSIGSSLVAATAVSRAPVALGIAATFGAFAGSGVVYRIASSAMSPCASRWRTSAPRR